jgi:hypothetical protein
VVTLSLQKSFGPPALIKVQIKSGRFDVVIEKATLDALLVNEKSAWDISDEGAAKIDACLSEVARVLKSDNGRWVNIGGLKC